MTANQYEADYFAEGLGAVAPSLDEKTADAAAQKLLDALALADDSGTRRDLAKALGAVAPRMAEHATAVQIVDAMALFCNSWESEKNATPSTEFSPNSPARNW